jgi:hypothetical protein
MESTSDRMNTIAVRANATALSASGGIVHLFRGRCAELV